VMMFEQVQDAPCFGVLRACGGRGEFNSGEIVLLTRGNGIRTLRLEGSVASMGMSLNNEIRCSWSPRPATKASLRE